MCRWPGLRASDPFKATKSLSTPRGDTLDEGGLCRHNASVRFGLLARCKPQRRFHLELDASASPGASWVLAPAALEPASFAAVVLWHGPRSCLRLRNNPVV